MVDSSSNVYFAEPFNNRIHKVSGGIIITIAGDNYSFLNHPNGLALDSSGNLYIADAGNNRIRKVSGWITTTVAGNGMSGFSGDSGLATSASLAYPEGVCVDSVGTVYIYDSMNGRVRRVFRGIITTIASRYGRAQ